MQDDDNVALLKLFTQRKTYIRYIIPTAITIPLYAKQWK